MSENKSELRWIIYSLSWLDKKQKATINPTNKIINALSHEGIKKYLQRKVKIKPFINKYNWEGTNFPSETDD